MALGTPALGLWQSHSLAIKHFGLSGEPEAHFKHGKLKNKPQA